ncbi:MAG TPA: GNAT family N-acetyltransferase, partial [Gemmatimonadaceae bacterium]|nr:GNAT family N-acetyltransferase [Gemmatimonadaceae bacterium]
YPARTSRAHDRRVENESLAHRRVSIYTFVVHNHSAVALSIPSIADQPLRPVVRRATRAHVDQIWELVSAYAAEGLMLPRTPDQIAMNIDNYVVAIANGRVVACAALEEYSPSLAEVSSVAVASSEHGNGLGTDVVLGVERLARARDINELFALSLNDKFFLSLDYAPTAIARYPEKLARYERLKTQGVHIVPKRCFQKMIGGSWQVPVLVEDAPAERALRAS